MTSTRPFAVATFVLLLLISTAQAATAQDLHPSRRPSPAGIAKALLGDTYLKVTYGRPYMRDRQIFGHPSDGNDYLVPFGDLWRTGANEATEITVTGPVLLAGQRLEEGTYSVFTVPGPSSWTVRFNTQLGMDGTGLLDPMSGEFAEAYDPSDDVLTIEVSSSTLDEDVEQLTIEFEPAASPGHIVLTWERTEVRIPVELPRG